MTHFYEIMIMISLIMLSGDSDSFAMFLIWHAVWLIIMLFCMYKVNGKASE